MDATPLVRLRWRLRGAWLWPAWLAFSIADGVIVSQFPLTGDRAGFVDGLLLGSVLSLIGIVVLGGGLGRIVRRFRPDMPRVVARNYGAAVIPVVVTAALLAGGLAHRGSVRADGAALREATARAKAYIGTHAPPAFQRELRRLSVYPVQRRESYRICATDPADLREYCVVVDLWQPFAQSVHASGSEPNSELAQGTG